MRPSSSTLGLWRQHCAAAALRQLRGEEIDRAPFGAGVAVHAALEAMASNRKGPLPAALASARALMQGERVYKGNSEPPYAADPVMEGLRLAITWAQEMGVPRGKPEVGLAVDRDWKIVEYGSTGHWYSQLIDLVRIYEDEDDGGELVRVVSMKDYKSSWGTSAAELDTLQMRGALCLGAALAEREGAGAVEIQVANLRKLRWIPREPRRLYPGRIAHDDKLEEYRTEIRLAVDALDEIAGREPDDVASPGAGCIACPYRDRCGAANTPPSATAAFAYGEVDVLVAAERHLASQAILDLVGAALQQHVKTTGSSIALSDDRTLGYQTLPRAALTEDAIPKLAAVLNWTADEETLARQIGISAGNVRNLLRALHGKEGANHEKLGLLEDDVLTVEYIERWGVGPRVIEPGA